MQLDFGTRHPLQTAKGAVTAALRLASDKFKAAAIIMRRPDGEAEAVAPEALVEAWRSVAQAESLPPQTDINRLCHHTLAGWARVPLDGRILLLDAWGYTQQRHPCFFLPRPLLRAMSACLWQQGSAASVPELNLAAVRTGPFMRTKAADLARSCLDAVVHHCAARASQDFKVAASLGPVLSMGAFASRTKPTQSQLHLLRQAASDARNPLEEAIYQRVAWMKTSLRCDSVTARSRVAAQLARDSMHHGGDIKLVFIKAFGHAPGEQEVDQHEETQQALEEWRHKQIELQMATAAGAPGRCVEGSQLSVYTVRSDGTSAAASPH